MRNTKRRKTQSSAECTESDKKIAEHMAQKGVKPTLSIWFIVVPTFFMMLIFLYDYFNKIRTSSSLEELDSKVENFYSDINAMFFPLLNALKLAVLARAVQFFWKRHQIHKAVMRAKTKSQLADIIKAHQAQKPINSVSMAILLEAFYAYWLPIAAEVCFLSVKDFSHHLITRYVSIQVDPNFKPLAINFFMDNKCGIFKDTPQCYLLAESNIDTLLASKYREAFFYVFLRFFSGILSIRETLFPAVATLSFFLGLYSRLSAIYHARSALRLTESSVRRYAAQLNAKIDKAGYSHFLSVEVSANDTEYAKQYFIGISASKAPLGRLFLKAFISVYRLKKETRVHQDQKSIIFLLTSTALNKPRDDVKFLEAWRAIADVGTQNSILKSMKGVFEKLSAEVSVKLKVILNGVMPDISMTITLADTRVLLPLLKVYGFSSSIDNLSLQLLGSKEAFMHFLTDSDAHENLIKTYFNRQRLSNGRTLTSWLPTFSFVPRNKFLKAPKEDSKEEITRRILSKNIDKQLHALQQQHPDDRVWRLQNRGNSTNIFLILPSDMINANEPAIKKLLGYEDQELELIPQNKENQSGIKRADGGGYRFKMNNNTEVRTSSNPIEVADNCQVYRFIPAKRAPVFRSH